MLLYRHPRIEVIVAGGTVRRADGAVVGSTATQLDRPVQGRLRHHRCVRDRRGGRAARLRLSRGAGGAGDHRQCPQRHAGRRLHQAPPQRAGAHRAHLSQIQTFVTDSPLAGRPRQASATSRGIEVVAAMAKPVAGHRRPAEPGASAAGVAERLILPEEAARHRAARAGAHPYSMSASAVWSTRGCARTGLARFGGVTAAVLAFPLAKKPLSSLFHLAFVFRCDLIQNESEIAQSEEGESPGKRPLDRVYDLAIIGGGINGCGIARDAAGRGHSVFLCEMNDLAQRDVVLVDQADPWRPALPRILRVPPGARGADRARGALAASRPTSSGRCVSFCRITPACGRPGCCAWACSSTTISAAASCCRRRARSTSRPTRSASR